MLCVPVSMHCKQRKTFFIPFYPGTVRPGIYNHVVIIAETTRFVKTRSVFSCKFLIFGFIDGL